MSMSFLISMTTMAMASASPMCDGVSSDSTDAFPAFSSGQFADLIPDYNLGLRDTDLSPDGRQLLARHLYVLLMALSGGGFEIPIEGRR